MKSSCIHPAGGTHPTKGIPATLRHTGLGLVLAIIASAQTTVAWSQTAGTWGFANTVTGTAGSHITVSNATLGSSIVSNAFNGGTEFYGQDGWPTGALDPNAYLQFTLTANAAYYLVLNSLSLEIRRSTTGTAAGSGPTQWILQSSLDGYTSNIASGTLSTSYTTFPITLPAAFQSIPSTVTFRLYGYSSVTTSGGFNRFVYQNITVSGQAIAGTLAEQNITLTAGAALSQSGASESNSSSASSQPGSLGSIPLQWKTVGFPAGTVFIAERSSNGRDFTSVDQQQNAGDGNEVYQYTDACPSGAPSLFYRIRAEEPDGSTYLSNIVAVNTGGASALRIKGVVAQGSSVKALIGLQESGEYQLAVYGMDGKTLWRQALQETAGDPMVDIPFGQYPHGVYILTLAKADQRISRQFVY